MHHFCLVPTCNGLVHILNGLVCIRTGSLKTLKSDSHYWSLTLRTETEINSALLKMSWLKSKVFWESSGIIILNLTGFVTPLWGSHEIVSDAQERSKNTFVYDTFSKIFKILNLFHGTNNVKLWKHREAAAASAAAWRGTSDLMGLGTIWSLHVSVTMHSNGTLPLLLTLPLDAPLDDRCGYARIRPYMH